MSGLDQDQGAFVRGVHNATGIDERVLIAWMYQEGAFQKGGTGGFNYFNVKHFQGDNAAGISSGGFSQFSNVQDAITATVAVLHQPNMRIIVSTAGSKPTPQQQITAIAVSPWDAKHYGGSGGPTLSNTFAKLFGGSHSLTTPYVKADITEGFKSDAADFSSIDMHTITNAVTDAGAAVVGAVTAPFTAIGDVISWVGNNWDRIFWVIGGSIAVILGLYFIFKSQSGENKFTFSRGDD